MTDYTLTGVYPFVGKHKDVIDTLLKPSPEEVKQIDLCCGRGFGKTFLAIYIATRALSIDGNQTGLFLEPDWASINSIFLDSWRKIVPSDLYTENKKEQKITWINGSVLYYGPRNISGSIEAMRNKYRGRNLTFVIDDEAAIGCDTMQYTNTLAAIRTPSPVRFYFTISTPLLGAYRQLITSPRHRLFRGTSRDNPYRQKGLVENLIANMSADQVRREIYAEFISLEGRIWKGAKYDPEDTTSTDYAWPNGNRNDIHTKFDPSKPWWLFCDIGSSTGAFTVMQQMDPVYRGNVIFKGPVWVAVADFCPDNDASANRAFQLLNDHFGTPAGVVAGADINTRASTDGTTVSYFAKQTWSNVRIYPCNESIYNKAIQYDRLSYLMCSASGDRRFTIARDFLELADTKRGVKQMINEDEWPDESKRRISDFLPKQKEVRVQHVRDALLMGSVEIMSRPQWGFTKDQVG
jgi:hypothetical protein